MSQHEGNKDLVCVVQIFLFFLEPVRIFVFEP